MLKFLLSLRFNKIYFIFPTSTFNERRIFNVVSSCNKCNQAADIIYSTLYALKWLKFDEREQRKNAQKSIQLRNRYDFQLSAASCDSQISYRTDMTNIASSKAKMANGNNNNNGRNEENNIVQNEIVAENGGRHLSKKEDIRHT